MHLSLPVLPPVRSERELRADHHQGEPGRQPDRAVHTRGRPGRPGRPGRCSILSCCLPAPRWSAWCLPAARERRSASVRCTGSTRRERSQRRPRPAVGFWRSERGTACQQRRPAAPDHPAVSPRAGMLPAMSNHLNTDEHEISPDANTGARDGVTAVMSHNVYIAMPPIWRRSEPKLSPDLARPLVAAGLGAQYVQAWLCRA